jgi:hypothetical protein
VSHTGRAAQVRSAFVDEAGRLYFETDIGFGLVHTLDVSQAADAIEQGVWQPKELASAQLPERFGYVPSPAGRHGNSRI